MTRIAFLFLGLFMTVSSMAQEVVILLGAPASGKGTQAKFISKELDVPHISTGDLFRENIKNQTKLGIEAQEYIDQGKLVPDSIVLNMLFDRIEQNDVKKGYILDGFPRTVSQAEIYEKHIGTRVKPTVIYIDVPEKILLERISSRQKLEGRKDDSQEVAKQRLKVYEDQTAPLISYYSSKGFLNKVEGNTSVMDVENQIRKILKK
jgi:adenylate kinase